MVFKFRYLLCYIEVLDLFWMENSIEVNYGDKESKKQLFLDVLKIGDVIQVYKLMGGDVDIDGQCLEIGNIVFMFVVEKDDKVIIELLLMEQVSVFLVNNCGLSVFILVYEKGYVVIVNMICIKLIEIKELDV